MIKMGKKQQSRKITLLSSDGDAFEIDEAVALESQTIKYMIEDDCANDTGIPISNVTSEILAMVIEYCKKHVEAATVSEEEKPWKTDGLVYRKKVSSSEEKISGEDVPKAAVSSEVKEVSKEDELEKWDAEFVKVDNVTLFELVRAANYLDIKNLLEFTCNTVAEIMHGKTSEQIRRTFKIANDFSPDEEEEIRKENQWAFE